MEGNTALLNSIASGISGPGFFFFKEKLQVFNIKLTEGRSVTMLWAIILFVTQVANI